MHDYKSSQQLCTRATAARVIPGGGSGRMPRARAGADRLLTEGAAR